MQAIRNTIAALALAAGTLAAQAAPAPGFALFDTQVHFYSNDFAHFPLHDEHAYMGQAVMTRRAAEHPTLPRRVFADWKAEGVGAGVGISTARPTAATTATCSRWPRAFRRGCGPW